MDTRTATPPCCAGPRTRCHWSCGPSTPCYTVAPSTLRQCAQRSCLLCYPRACAVARKHTLGRLQFAELTGQLLVLCIDTRQRLADPLLLFGDLIQCRHSLPSRQ